MRACPGACVRWSAGAAWTGPDQSGGGSAERSGGAGEELVSSDVSSALTLNPSLSYMPRPPAPLTTTDVESGGCMRMGGDTRVEQYRGGGGGEGF